MLCNTKHYLAHKGFQTVPIVSQTNPTHAVVKLFCKTHFSIIFPLSLQASGGLLCSLFPTECHVPHKL